jgi:hypothetical protein
MSWGFKALGTNVIRLVLKKSIRLFGQEAAGLTSWLLGSGAIQAVDYPGRAAVLSKLFSSIYENSFDYAVECIYLIKRLFDFFSTPVKRLQRPSYYFIKHGISPSSGF